jgi:1,4-alpha-glucan branching enzyme
MSTGKFYNVDPWLKPFTGIIEGRLKKCHLKERELIGSGSLAEFAMGHYYYGLHRAGDKWIFREYAPNATSIFVIGTFTGWKEAERLRMNRLNAYGDWEISIPAGDMNHGDLYKLSVHWNGGKGERIPSYANRVVQDEKLNHSSPHHQCP